MQICRIPVQNCFQCNIVRFKIQNSASLHTKASHLFIAIVAVFVCHFLLLDKFLKLMGQFKSYGSERNRTEENEGSAREKARFNFVLGSRFVQQLWICCDVDSCDRHYRRR